METESENEKIILPQALYEQLELTPDKDKVEAITVAKDSFTLRAAHPKRDVAPRWFLLPTLFAALIFTILVVILHPHVIPLSGSDISIATGTLVIANGTAFITFILSYLARRHELYHTMEPKIYWRTFPTVLAAYLIISSLAQVAFFWFIDQIFHGVAFDKMTSVIIFTLFAGVLNYLVIFFVDTFDIRMLVSMLIAVMVGGLVSSMATNGNQYWWQRNFSLLGTTKSHAGWQFNMTLVVSAALFIALIDYIFVSLADKYGHNWRHTVLRALLTLCALSIAGVGLIPNNGMGLAHFWHDQISMFIVYFMGFAILGIRWLLPEAPKNLIRMSYGIVGALLVVYLLWHPTRYLTLTAFEILSFTLSFAWLMLFINSLINLLWDERRVYRVVVNNKSEK